MDVSPTRRGEGTRFLKHVLEYEGMDPKEMSVCAVNTGSKKFFERVGFAV